MKPRSKERMRRKRTVVVFALLCLAISSSCSRDDTLPPLTEDPAATQIPGKFVWHNLITGDAEAARGFYGGLFGWEFDVKAEGRYSIISYGGHNIGGIVDASKDGKAPKSGHWLSAVSVTDLEQTLRKVETAGGKQLEEPIDVSGVGRVVTVEDADGALLHLLAPSHGDPPDVEPPVHTWLWHELISNDPKRALGFYEAVFGYRVEQLRKNPSSPYRVLWSFGEPRAGVIKNPFETARSAWIPYVRVQDPAASAQRAAELGGRVVVEPEPDIRNGTLALVLDPSGAPLALQKWSPEEGVDP